MATTTHKITAEEFLKMDLGDGLQELVRGEIIEASPGKYFHGWICGNIFVRLYTFGHQTGHGHAATNDSAVGISADTVRGPDVCYFSEARWPKSQIANGLPPVAPDLAVEVYSPGNRPGEMMEKVADYLRAGVLMVWVVHPERRTVTIYRPDDPTPRVLTEQDVIEGLPDLPGFRCPVAEFFA